MDSTTELYGIIGKPVKHSLSPVMHNAAFKQKGLNAVYLAFETDDVRCVASSMRCLGIKGLSVTIPNKEAIITVLDETDETVTSIGACNTVRNQGGILQGTNTDWLGAVTALKKRTDLKGKKVVVLGAGGSARAIVFGLVKEGAQVTICNRTVEKAEKLALEFGCHSHPLSEAKDLSGHIIINTTSVGMNPMANKSPVSSDVIGNFTIAMDIVYSPLETLFLKHASKQGKETINGLEMLLYQAIAQFEYWTGTQAPVQTMREALYHAVQ